MVDFLHNQADMRAGENLAKALSVFHKAMPAVNAFTGGYQELGNRGFSLRDVGNVWKNIGANVRFGFANNGIVFGAFSAIDRYGLPSSSLKATGTTNWVRLNIGPDAFANDFTFALWAKVDDFESYYATILAGDKGSVRGNLFSGYFE